MNNLDDVIKEDIKEHNQNLLKKHNEILDHPYKNFNKLHLIIRQILAFKTL